MKILVSEEYKQMGFYRDFGDLISLREALNRLIEEHRTPSNQRGDRPQLVPLNIYETDNSVVIEAPMPGVKPEDIELSFASGVLTIKASPKSVNTGRNYLVQEWQSSPYFRSLQLPETIDVDSASASIEDGILRINFDKRRRSEPRKIQVKIGG